MKRCVSITCDFDLAIGKVNLNEIVYKLKELRDSLMLGILKQILISYDDLIMDRLTQTKIYPSKMRNGLGRHMRKDDAEERFCRGRKVYRRGYRSRKIKTVFGSLNIEVRMAGCLTCGSRYRHVGFIPLSLKIRNKSIYILSTVLKQCRPRHWHDQAPSRL